MKIKCLFLTALLLAVATIGFAQAKKPIAKKTAANTPEQVVKDLFAAQKSEKTNPFTQTQSRALVDRYFAKDIADMIWKTGAAANGELVKSDIDPLYGTDYPEITNLVFGSAKEKAGPDDVFVKVTYRDLGTATSTRFSLRREANKTWKIYDIGYSSTGDEFAAMLECWTNEECGKGSDAKTFQGSYTVGATKCEVSPSSSHIVVYRVSCDGQAGFKLYAVKGTDKETTYVYTDEKGKHKDKFVFKGDEKDGKFIDAAGKVVKVKRVQ
jgi:Protein of unknown function (DUF3828)